MQEIYIPEGLTKREGKTRAQYHKLADNPHYRGTTIRLETIIDNTLVPNNNTFMNTDAPLI